MATWYVRPTTGHNSTRNGTSYSTAWGTWAEIVWGVSGVAPGDTLYICGTHTASANYTPGVHGAVNENGRVYIKGNYEPDPGKIIFTDGFFNHARAYTEISDLILVGALNTTVIFMHGSATYCNYRNLHITANGGAHMNLWAIDGQNHSNILIDSCVFTGKTYSGAGNNSAIYYYLEATNATGSVSNITITNNLFVDLDTARAAVHLRTDSDVNVASVISGVVCDYNIFRRIKGKPFEITNGVDILSHGAGLKVRYNDMEDCARDGQSDTLGGCTFYGFGPSTSLGRPEISYNRFVNVSGRAGAVNVFYGPFDIHHNYANGIYSKEIDGNGILIDHGCNDTNAWANEMHNLPGSAGNDNSGCAIMVLDATNVRIWGNLFSNVNVGMHIGPAGTGQSCLLYNNTIVGINLYAIDLSQFATEAAAVVKNNIFIGATPSVVSVRNGGGAWSLENYNCFYNFTVPSGHSFGANTLTSNPLLYSNYLVRDSSPVKHAGNYVANKVDLLDNYYNNPPSIGAYEYVVERGVR